MGPKFWERLIILGIIIVLIGPDRLAGLGGAVGKAVREFREATRSDAPTDARPRRGAGEEG